MKITIFLIVISLLICIRSEEVVETSNNVTETKPTLHMIGLFHTITSKEFTHCAFTAKVLKFSKMMQMYGWKIIEYGNAFTESTANEFVQILTEDEVREFRTAKKKTDFFGNDAVVGSTLHSLFEERLIPAMKSRVKDFDIILHPFGKAHQSAATHFPKAFQVESGIGYNDPFLSFKIFESYSWMHYYYGVNQAYGSNYNWVVPNYFNVEEWDFSPEISEDKPIVFMGRITELKGIATIAELAKTLKHKKFKIAGQGNFTHFFDGLPNVEYFGPLEGKERSDFLKGAVAMLLPTTFNEPFGGAIVEAQFCGIPGITTNYGAFSETIEHGVTGFRCNTLGDWIAAISEAEKLDRKYIRERAIRLYSLEAVGKRYDAIFKQIYDLRGEGWYSPHSYSVTLNKPGQSACS